MCCSGSASIPQAALPNSPRAYGSSTSRAIHCAPKSATSRSSQDRRSGMSFDLNAIRQGLASLEERLRPIATRPVNINDRDWVDRLRQAPSPLDQAGVRLEAETILGSLLQAYRTEGSFVRASIR